MAETGTNITDHDSVADHPDLPETANAEVRSKGRSKLKRTGAFFTAMVVMMAVAGLGFNLMVNYFTLTENTSVNITAIDDVPVTAKAGIL